MHTNKQVIGYVRVSTEEQGRSGVGLQAQRAAINDACTARGWQLLRIEEDRLSGAAEPEKRPGLQRALQAVESDEATGLVVAKLDRLTRSLPGFAKLVERSRASGWEIVILDLNVDTTTPTGEAMASMLAVFAQWERRMIGQRIGEALAVKRQQGVRLGRPPAVDPQVRRRIRGLRTRGWSYRRIADRLNDEHVPTAHGGAAWHPATVRSIVGSSRTMSAG
jgi:DNA invertase Pin-like site-specific DNA recombinase